MREPEYVENYMEPNPIQLEGETKISVAEKRMMEKETDVAVVKLDDRYHILRDYQLWGMNPDDLVKDIPKLEEVKAVRRGTKLSQTYSLLRGFTAIVVLNENNELVGLLRNYDIRKQQC